MRDHLQITFPRVEGYTVRINGALSASWNRFPVLTLDPLQIADAEKVPRYEVHRGPGSSRDVDFWTSKRVRQTERSHVNLVVADTTQWEQSAAFYLETGPHVLAYVQNVNLGFAIPYEHGGATREYLPDFLVRVQKNGQEVGTLILETKGYDPLKHIKIGAAHRWIHAVNAEGSYGRWAYRIVSSPAIVPPALASAAEELANPPRTDWRAAVAAFCAEMRRLYEVRLDSVVLYGSRARGDAEWDSDVDLLVVLDQLGEFWPEFERINDVAGRLFVEHGVLLSALPTDVTEFRESSKSVFGSARRGGEARRVTPGVGALIGNGRRSLETGCRLLHDGDFDFSMSYATSKGCCVARTHRAVKAGAGPRRRSARRARPFRRGHGPAIPARRGGPRGRRTRAA
ncbi:MAG: nucleotidyltransferase domain-containing protein, partial [bacterium]